MTGEKNTHPPVYGVKEFVTLTFLVLNNYPDAHHSQWGMKFATQISPLLNFRPSKRSLLATTGVASGPSRSRATS